MHVSYSPVFDNNILDYFFVYQVSYLNTLRPRAGVSITTGCTANWLDRFVGFEPL